jgi:hypothetical protein
VRDATALAGALEIQKQLDVEPNALCDTPLASPNTDDAAA